MRALRGLLLLVAAADGVAGSFLVAVLVSALRARRDELPFWLPLAAGLALASAALLTAAFFALGRRRGP
jgi:chromate transport protein ChrA